MHALFIIFFAPLALLLGLALARNFFWILLVLIFLTLFFITSHSPSTSTLLPSPSYYHDTRPVEPRLQFDIQGNTHHYQPSETVSGRPQP